MSQLRGRAGRLVRSVAEGGARISSRYGAAAGGHDAGVLDPEPSHVLAPASVASSAPVRRGEFERDHLTTTTPSLLPASGGQLDLIYRPPASGQAEAKSLTCLSSSSVRAKSTSGVRRGRRRRSRTPPRTALPVAGRDDLYAGRGAASVVPGRRGRARWPRHGSTTLVRTTRKKGWFSPGDDPDLLLNADDVVPRPDGQAHRSKCCSSTSVRP